MKKALAVFLLIILVLLGWLAAHAHGEPFPAAFFGVVGAGT